MVKNSTKPVFWRLMLPMSVILITLVIGGRSIIVHQQKLILNEQINFLNERISGAFNSEIEDLAKGLSMILTTISKDPELKKSLRNGDNEVLYQNWHNIYIDLLNKFNINHFTFLNSSRERILRLHNLTMNGGVVNRYTALQAEKTGKTAWGIELEMGSLEQPTLRVVEPVFYNDTLVGYVELGEDLDEIIEEIHQRTKSPLLLTINKSKISKERWQSTMSQVNRDSTWSLLNSRVVIYSTVTPIPTNMVELVNSYSNTLRYSNLQVNNSVYLLSSVDVFDAAGEQIGDLFFLKDVTALKEDFKGSINFITALSVVLLISLIALVYILLSSTDKQLLSQRNILIESEKKYRNLFNSIGDAVVVTDYKGNIIEYNNIAEQYYGYSPEELRKITTKDIIHPSHVDVYKKNLRIIQTGEETLIESKHIRKDGTTFPVELKSSEIKVANQPAILSVIRNISERKRIDELVKIHSEQFNAILSTAHDGLFIVNPSGQFVEANDAICQMSGYTKEELLKLTILDLEALDTLDDIEKRIQGIKSRGWDKFESVHRRKDGNTYHVNVSVAFNKTRNELIGFVSDITKEKEAFRLLSEANERFNLLEEAVNFGIWEWNIDTHQVHWSKQFSRLLGYTKTKENIDINFYFKHVHPSDIEDLRNAITKLPESKKAWENEHRIYRHDGKERWIYSKGKKICTAGKISQKLVGIALDITDKKKSEVQLSNAISDSN